MPSALPGYFAGFADSFAKVALVLLLLDVMVVVFTIFAIASGETVMHVPFWDAQIKFIVSVLS